jgi:hypothetical protein
MPSQRKAKWKSSDRIRLANGIRVSRLCLGMTSTPRTILEAHRMGLNFFFVSCDAHWPLYAGVREGLSVLFRRKSVRREDIVVCLVSYTGSGEFVPGAIREVCAEVPGLRFADVLCAGAIYSHDAERRLRGLRENAAGGVAGAVAGSFHDRAAALWAMKTGNVDLAFIRYNPLHLGARTELFPHLAGMKVPLFNFKSTTGFMPPVQARTLLDLDEDTWMPSIVDYYRFVVYERAFSGILCAPQSPRELTELVSAIEAGPLSKQEMEHLVGLAYRAAERRIVISAPILAPRRTIP